MASYEHLALKPDTDVTSVVFPTSPGSASPMASSPHHDDLSIRSEPLPAGGVTLPRPPESPLSFLLAYHHRLDRNEDYDDEETEKAATLLSSFMNQSEYGPLSYVLSFLPIVEVLPLRRVSSFFQDFVRVALSLREASDAELVDLNVRCGNFLAELVNDWTKGTDDYNRKDHFQSAFHYSSSRKQFDDGTGTSTTGDAAAVRSCFPRELLECFGFLALSNPSYCFVHVNSVVSRRQFPEDHRWHGGGTPRGTKLIMRTRRHVLNLLASESLLKKGEDKEEEGEREREKEEDPLGSRTKRTQKMTHQQHRFSHFVWATRLQFTFLDKGFKMKEHESYAQYKDQIFVAKDHSVDEKVWKIPYPLLQESEVEEEEEEGEQQQQQQQQQQENQQFVRLRRGRVEYSGVFAGDVQKERVIPSSRCGGERFQEGLIDSFLEKCRTDGLVPLYSAEIIKDWLSGALNYGRQDDTELVVRLLEGCPPVLMGFVHETLVHRLGRTYGSYDSIFYGGWRDKPERRAGMALALLQHRSLSYVDPFLWFLNRVFEAPIGWTVEEKGSQYSTTPYLSLQHILKTLMDERGYAVDFTDKQYRAQMKGMAITNSKRERAAWGFMESLGMTFEHMFENGRVNPLMQAAQFGANHVFAFFLEKMGNEAFRLVDSYGRNVLHYAVLAPESSSTYMPRRNTSTPYYYQSAEHGVLINTVLKSQPEDLDLTTLRDKFGETPVEYALSETKFGNARILLDYPTMKSGEIVVRWDLSKTSPLSVFEKVEWGRNVYKTIEEHHELIFSADLRKEVFDEACEKTALDLAAMVIPPHVDDTTPDSDAIVPLVRRQKLFVDACESISVHVDVNYCTTQLWYGSKRQCNMVDVARFVVHSLPLDAKIGSFDPKLPLHFAAATKEPKILKRLAESARRSTRWTSHLLPMFREIVPEIILKFLKELGPSLWDVTPKVALFRWLVALLDDETVDSLLPMMEEHSLSLKFFPVVARSCPRLLSTKISDLVSPSVKEELFCDSLARGDSEFAAGIIPLLDVASSLSADCVGLRGGWVCCHSRNPVCLALHGKMPSAMKAGLSVLDGEVKEAVVMDAGRCLLSLPPFLLRKFEHDFLACVGVLAEDYPNMLATVLEDNPNLPGARFVSGRWSV